MYVMAKERTKVHLSKVGYFSHDFAVWLFRGRKTTNSADRVPSVEERGSSLTAAGPPGLQHTY